MFLYDNKTKGDLIMERKRFVKQELEFDEQTKRIIRAAAWTREHFPWIVKILEPIAKRRGW